MRRQWHKVSRDFLKVSSELLDISKRKLLTYLAILYAHNSVIRLITLLCAYRMDQNMISLQGFEVITITVANNVA